jgi:hypothetical protein
MIKLRKALCVGLALGLLVSSQATARRIIVDQGEFLPSGTLGTGCTIGGAVCTATTLPFFFDFGSGSTNLAYIYDRGIISFGDPILGVDPTGAFTSFGVPVIAPLYVPGSSGTPGPYQVGTVTIGHDDFGFEETLPNFGTDLFLINFLDPTTIDEENNLSALISVIFDFSATELRIEFAHGMSGLGFDENGNSTVIFVLPDTTGTQMGFSLGGNQFFQAPPNIEATNAFSITSDNAIPEPGTWMTMLLGFGLTGFALRRARRLRPQPA